MTPPDRIARIAWLCVVLMTAVAVLVSVATAQMAPPPPSLEDRLDQCNADRGTLTTEAARLNYQLREAGKLLTAEGFKLQDGRWIKPKKDEPKKDEGKK